MTKSPEAARQHVGAAIAARIEPEPWAVEIVTPAALRRMQVDAAYAARDEAQRRPEGWA